MIFLTLGTTSYSFKRLLEGVDQALITLKSKEILFAQIGVNDYCFRYSHVKVFKEIPFGQMINLFIISRVVVAHGGLGTALLCLSYSKHKPVLVPRIKNLGEHIDNHQIFLVDYLAEKKLVKGILPQDNFIEKLVDFLKRPQAVVSMKSDRQKLINRLCDYTDKLSIN